MDNTHFPCNKVAGMCFGFFRIEGGGGEHKFICVEGSMCEVN